MKKRDDIHRTSERDGNPRRLPWRLSPQPYTFSGAEPRIRQQYLRSRNRAVQLYTAAAVRDHGDLKCCALNHWIFTCGKEFGVKTVYTSVALPVFLGIFERIFPDYESLTGSQELDVLCYILVVSVGLSILFNRNASSGGLDIVAKIMNKYLHMELGKAMSLSGMCVALSAALVYDKKTVVLSILEPILTALCWIILF